MIDWKPGIPGGIPTYPIAIDVTTPPYNAVGDGVTDCTAGIQAAINACASEKAVYIPAGTYVITSLDLHNRKIALRGAGPDKTFLKSKNASDIIKIRGTSDSHTPIPITSGATKGSTQVVVSSATDIAVGSIWAIHAGTPMAVESTSGCNSNCEWGSGFAQPVKITAKNGNIVTFSPGLYFDMSSNSPEFELRGTYTSRCGVEDLRVEATAKVSDKRLFAIEYAEECWLRNVEGYMCNYAHVRLRFSKSCEIRDSYFHHAWEYIGSWAYGLFIFDFNADHLIENNIFYHIRHAMIFEGGGCGCVFGYNYSVDPQGRSSANTPNNWLYSDICTHGRHSFMNLWEGNICGQISLDNMHGSSSHNTLFRNWSVGKAKNTDNPNGVTDGRNVVEVMKNNIYENFIGNVLGYSGCGYRFEQYPVTDYDRNIWVTGYACDTAGSGSRDTTPAVTMLRHGNFDYATNSTEWDPNIIDRNLPNSYYLSSKPAFFGDLAWPCIGPDIDLKATTLPAQKRYNDMVK